MNLEQVIELLKEFSPVSIFLYGSQATKDTNAKSDYEIGIVFNDNNYVNRATIKQKVQSNKFSIFPFKKNSLLDRNIDTPFQKSIFLNTLILGSAKTIFGEKIIENLHCPQITKYDLLMDTSFNLGYALSSVQVMKQNNFELANEMLYKSAFYATRNLIFNQIKILPIGYSNIYYYSTKLEIPEEYRTLLSVCVSLRENPNQEIDKVLFFKNISYINQFIIPLIETTEN